MNLAGQHGTNMVFIKKLIIYEQYANIQVIFFYTNFNKINCFIGRSINQNKITLYYVVAYT